MGRRCTKDNKIDVDGLETFPRVVMFLCFQSGTGYFF